MDIKYRVYTEVVLYLHDAEDYYDQLENFEEYIGTYPDEEFFENVSTTACNVSDILKVSDNGDCRQIVLQDSEHYLRYIEVIETMDEIKKTIRDLSETYDIPIKHIKFYNNNIEIS